MNLTLDRNKRYNVTLRCGGKVGPVVYRPGRDWPWALEPAPEGLAWSDDGTSQWEINNHPLDMVDAEEIKEPRVIEGWLNIYPTMTMNLHATRGHADHCAASNRVACIKFRCTEGEGLT